MDISKNQRDALFAAYKDSSDRFRFMGLLKTLQKPLELVKSFLLNIMNVNKLSLKSFFETLRVTNNNSNSWSTEELQRIDKNFGFGIDLEAYEEVIFEWGKKIKGRMSMFELAVGLGVKVEASAIDVDFIRKE